MKVCGVRTAGRRIESIETETGSRPLRHTASNYLLASGGILGGGIRGDRSGRVRETVFDLPLTAPQSRSKWLRPIFLDRRGHPVFQGGVSVDASFRPLGQDNAPLHENLWAAGSVLAHTDSIPRAQPRRNRDRDRLCRRAISGTRTMKLESTPIASMQSVPPNAVGASLDACIKCNICTSYCPVSEVTDSFPGPKYAAPQSERFREFGYPFVQDATNTNSPTASRRRVPRRIRRLLLRLPNLQ